MTIWPAVTVMGSDCLPTPNEIAIEDVEPFTYTPWPNMGGAIQYRNRRGDGTINAAAQEFTLLWDHADLAMVDAIRFHHRSYYHGEPFELVLPCDAAATRLQYVGPLQVERFSTYSRVRVRVRRVLAASTT